jgi:predicted DNA-binding transcriptional regulator YafY
MRADRLLHLLLYLQIHGLTSAERLATELEVSLRTIYRDVDALGTAGVPLYSQRGPGGGIALDEAYRTSLTGLNPEEAQALFMLGVPAVLKQLGVDQALKAALLKLSASLSPAQRIQEHRVRQRIHLDSSPSDRIEEPLPCLGAIQQALWSDRRLRLRYELEFFTEIEQVAEPYGLVAWVNRWYLVCRMGECLRALPVARILAAEVLAEPFTRPDDFDLAGFWRQWVAQTEAIRPAYRVRVRVSPDLLGWIQRHFGQAARQQAASAQPDSQGWITLELAFESIYSARTRLLAYGGAVEVLEPAALRLSLADFARQVLLRYPQEPG